MLNHVKNTMRNGKVVMLCAFLFAGCVAEDESLAPDVTVCQDENELVLSEIDSEILATGRVSTSSQKNFRAHLSSGDEIPANDSRGVGEAIFKLSEDGTSLHYKLIVANIEGVTQAHIHCGGSTVNGPVVVFLYGFNSAGITQNGVLAEGTITQTNIIKRPSTAACMGGLTTFANLIERMNNGTAYVNVHTLTKPGGEIRGQIK